MLVAEAIQSGWLGLSMLASARLVNEYSFSKIYRSLNRNIVTDNFDFFQVSWSRRHNRTFPELQRHLHPAVPEQGALLLLVLITRPNINPQERKKKNYFNEIHSDFHKRKVIPRCVTHRRRQ